MTEAWRVRVAGLALIGAICVAFANGFATGFVGLDAKESIRDNPNLHHLLPLTRSLSLDESVLGDTESKGGTLVRRPVLSFTFALNHVLLGDHPAGFHAVNLAIHTLAALLLFGVARRCFAAPVFGQPPLPADALGFAVALLWAVHPLQCESVTYLVQRAESLMGLLYLSTLYAAVRHFESGYRNWLAAAVLACGLGMGTKESMATAPLLVFAYDALIVSGTPRAAWQRHAKLHLSLAATWLVVLALIVHTAGDAAKDFREGRTLSYILSQPGVLLHYLRVALWPDDLFLYVNTYAFTVRPERTPLLQWLVPAACIVAALAGTAVACLRRHPFGLAGLWFFLILAPTSSIVATSDTIQEHRMYLPLSSVLALVIVAGWRLAQACLGSRARRLAGVVLLLLSLAAVGRTRARNLDFHSEFGAVYPRDLQEAYSILVDHELRVRAPHEAAEAARRLVESTDDPAEVALAHFTLGHVHERLGEAELALPHFQRVTEMQPDLPHGFTQLGAVLLQLDRRDEAEAVLRRAVAAEPDFAAAHLELGVARAAAGDLDEARLLLRRALELQPLYPEAALELGVVERDSGDAVAAGAAFELALRQRPDFVDAHQEMAELLDRTGDAAAAARHRTRAIELLQSQLPQATPPTALHLRLGALYRAAGDLAAARAQWEEAARLDPHSAEAPLGLGALARHQGDLVGARRYFERARELEPASADAAAELGAVLADLGELDAAEVHLTAALELQPHHADAMENLGVVRALQGRRAEAEEWLTRALRARPESERIRRRLEHVRQSDSPEPMEDR